MTQPPVRYGPEPVSTSVIWVDAAGRVTTDQAKAVRGEVTERFADGTTRSTLFVINPDR